MKNIEFKLSETRRQTRSSIKMDIDKVETTENTLLGDGCHQQQQPSHLDTKMRNEDATETEATSSTSVEQTPACATEQSNRNSDNKTGPATTSESADKVDDVDNNEGDDDDYFIDVSPVVKSFTDSVTDDIESVKLAPNSSSTEMTFNSPVEVEYCKDDVREISVQVKPQCDELPMAYGCVAGTDTKLSGTEERTVAEDETDMDVVETRDSTLHHHHCQQQQEQHQLSHSGTMGQTEDAREIEMKSESWNLAQDKKQNDEDKAEHLVGRDEEERLEHLEAETTEWLQQQPETVEDLTKRQVEESAEGDQPDKRLGKTDVPDSEADVAVSEPNSDEETSVSPLQTDTAWPPLPPPASMLFPGEGPPVPVIRVTCGERRAELHVDRLADGLGPVSNSIGTSRTSLCVRTVDDDVWMTPNQFQRASGRGTARDWKRSIKHHGVSLKSLLSKSVLSFDAASPGCRCNICTVSVLAKMSSSSNFPSSSHPSRFIHWYQLHSFYTYSFIVIFLSWAFVCVCCVYFANFSVVYVVKNISN